MGCGQSKNHPRSQFSKLPSLFNYKLKGEWDQEVKKDYDQRHKDVQKSPVFQMTEENYHISRQAFKQMAQIAVLPIYSQYTEQCSMEERLIDATPFGTDNQALTVLIHRPKEFKVQKKTRPCIMFAHGGGAIMLNASDVVPIVSRFALQSDCIIINVDYRLAPEAKAPKGILDFYAATKWAVKNAQQLGIDLTRLGMLGESGGGYICTGACMKMIERGEENLIKLHIATVPMTTDRFLTTKDQDLNDVERVRAQRMRVIYALLAENKEKQKQDPYIFPNLMGDKIAKKIPKTVIFTSQFDFLRKGCEELAQLLRRNGRLLDICIHPGTFHGWFAFFKYKSSANYFNDVARVIDKWLIQ